MPPPFCIAAGGVLKNVCLAAFTVRITNQITKKFVRTTRSTPMLMAGFNRSYNILIPPVPMEMLPAALLHDIVEDTEVTIEQVEIIFGKQVAEIVRGAT